MSFGHPTLLLGLLLLPLVALLYVRRTGRREHVVPSVMLWRAAADDAAAETGKHLGALDGPLVFALLFLAAALLAASEPRLAAGSRTAPNLLVFIDRSASMKTGDRWKRSVAEVTDILGRLDAGTVNVVGLPLAAGPARKELSPRAAQAELAALRPTDLPLDIKRELLRCAGLARSASAVLVVTDDPKPVSARLAGRPVLVFSHGGPSDNVAIDAFEVSSANGGLAVFAAVRNYSGRRRRVPFRVLADGRLVGEAVWTLEPGDRATFVSTRPIHEADAVEVRIDAEDELSADNRAVAVRSGKRRVRVAYVGRGNAFLRRALEQLPGVEWTGFRLTRDVAAGFDLTVYDGVVPDALPPGDVVLIDPPASVGGFVVRGAAENREGLRVTTVTRSPLLRYVKADALRFRRVVRVAGDARTRALLATGEGPVLLVRDDAERSVLVIACALDPAETNWPLRASFPIFWSNVVAGVAGRRNAAATVPEYSRTGEAIVVREVSGAAPAVTGPDGKPVPVMPGRGARVRFLPLRAGVYTVTAGGQRRRFAVNLLHPSESRSTGARRVPSAGELRSALAEGRRVGVPLGRYFAIAALVFALAYWAAAGRVGR